MNPLRGMAQRAFLTEDQTGVSTADERHTNDCGGPQAQAAQLPDCEADAASRDGVEPRGDSGPGLPGPFESISLALAPWGRSGKWTRARDTPRSRPSRLSRHRATRPSASTSPESSRRPK